MWCGGGKFRWSVEMVEFLSCWLKGARALKVAWLIERGAHAQSCLVDWKGCALSKLLGWLKGARARAKWEVWWFFSSFLLPLRVDENRSACGDTNPFDFFKLRLEREVNKCPYITLASLKVMTSDQMYLPTLTGRSLFMSAWSFGIGFRLLWRPLGFSLNKYVYYMRIYFPGNFHQNVLTLTISFIGLNASIWFVLIYCPHPV